MLDSREIPQVHQWLGVTYQTILSPADTGGAMSIVRSASPLGSGPPRHVHAAEDETFVMLSGRLELWIEGVTSYLDAGESAMIPRGTEHTFRAVGDGPADKLIILTPGGFEGFFAEMARGQFAIPVDMDAINESAARFAMTFTGPPLGAE